MQIAINQKTLFVKQNNGEYVEYTFQELLKEYVVDLFKTRFTDNKIQIDYTFGQIKMFRNMLGDKHYARVKFNVNVKESLKTTTMPFIFTLMLDNGEGDRFNVRMEEDIDGKFNIGLGEIEIYVCINQLQDLFRDIKLKINFINDIIFGHDLIEEDITFDVRKHNKTDWYECDWSASLKPIYLKGDNCGDGSISNFLKCSFPKVDQFMASITDVNDDVRCIIEWDKYSISFSLMDAGIYNLSTLYAKCYTIIAEILFPDLIDITKDDSTKYYNI